jgi:hypothetical protein
VREVAQARMEELSFVVRSQAVELEQFARRVACLEGELEAARSDLTEAVRQVESLRQALQRDRPSASQSKHKETSLENQLH